MADERFGAKLLDHVHHHGSASLNKNFVHDPFSLRRLFVDTGTFIVDRPNLSSFTLAFLLNGWRFKPKLV